MDTTFFWLSKLLWVLVSPDNLFVLLTATCLALMLRGMVKAAKPLLMFLVSTMILISLFPIGEWMLYPLESRFQTNPPLPNKVEGIIVLSGPEDPVASANWNQVELGSAAERDLAFMQLVRRYPNAKAIFTGGSGILTDQTHKGAHVAKQLFAEQGLDVTKILFEDQSRNTAENAKYSYALAQPKPTEKWILITTAWHMPRSVGVFNKLGWAVLPYPVDHYTNPNDLFRVEWDFSGNLDLLNTATKEWVGLVAYYWMGKL